MRDVGCGDAILSVAVVSVLVRVVREGFPSFTARGKERSRVRVFSEQS